MKLDRQALIEKLIQVRRLLEESKVHARNCCKWEIDKMLGGPSFALLDTMILYAKDDLSRGGANTGKDIREIGMDAYGGSDKWKKYNSSAH